MVLMETAFYKMHSFEYERTAKEDFKCYENIL